MSSTAPTPRASSGNGRAPAGAATGSVLKITLALDDNDRFYPIPSDAIAVNPLLTQNPGY